MEKHKIFEKLVSVVVICLFIGATILLYGCGGGADSYLGEPRVEYRANWCYLRTADWLLHGDPTFQFYHSMQVSMPPEGYVLRVFDDYNHNPDLEASYYPPGEWTLEEVEQWLDCGYRLGIRYYVGTFDGVRRYHAEPLYAAVQIMGKEEVGVYVAGEFSETLEEGGGVCR